MWPLYDPFLRQKPRFQKKIPPWDLIFSQFVLCLTFNNSTSQNIGGTDAWAVPPPQILRGTVPPVLPKSPPMQPSKFLSSCALAFSQLTCALQLNLIDYLASHITRIIFSYSPHQTYIVLGLHESSCLLGLPSYASIPVAGDLTTQYSHYVAHFQVLTYGLHWRLRQGALAHTFRRMRAVARWPAVVSDVGGN